MQLKRKYLQHYNHNMSLLDSLLASIAPHDCVMCGTEGHLLCRRCKAQILPVPKRCYRCRKLTPTAQTCKSCRSSSQLYAVHVGALYEGAVKEVIWQLKFHGAQAAAKVLAGLITVPTTPRMIVTHAPTSSQRVRERGYDQAQLLAKALAKELRLPYCKLLTRVSPKHQVGASRHLRRTQLRSAFRTVNTARIAGAHILIVDDVLTTGATLEAAAQTLKVAGAARLEAGVFAQA